MIVNSIIPAVHTSKKACGIDTIHEFRLQLQLLGSMKFRRQYHVEGCLFLQILYTRLVIFQNFTLIQHRSHLILAKLKLISSMKHGIQAALKLRKILKISNQSEDNAQYLFQKSHFGNNTETQKSRYQIFLVLFNFPGFLYFLLNILSGFVV